MQDDLLFILSQTDPDTGAVKRTTLKYVPDGWEEGSITWERSLKYWGMARSFTLPLKWVKDGAKYLRDAFYAWGALAMVQVTVQKLNKLTLQYITVYQGKIDFKTYKDYDFYVEANMIDGGLWELIKDSAKNEYTIPYFKFETPTERDATIFSPLDGSGIYAIRLITLFKWLCDKMTNGAIKSGTYGVRSNLLSSGGYWYDKLMITTGAAWRLVRPPHDGTSPDDPNPDVIKTSFDDFFQSLNAVTPIGIGVELSAYGTQTIVLESFDYFFKDSIFKTLGEAKELTAGWVQDWMINKLVVKYPEKEIEDATYTITEPNSNSAFRQKDHCFANNAPLELESKYRADFSGLAVIVNERIPDENDGWDEDIWFCEVKPTGKIEYAMNDGFVKQKLAGGGLSDPMPWYNCLLSPARNVRRNMALVGNYMYRLNGYLFNFTSGGYYNHLNQTWSKYDMQFIQEYGDIGITLGGVFKPVEITFDSPYDAQFVDLVNRFPDYVLRFMYLGEYYDGYFKKMEVRLSGRGTTKFTLIAHKDTNLENLIR